LFDRGGKLEGESGFTFGGCSRKKKKGKARGRGAVVPGGK